MKVSPSQIETADMCPLKWWFCHVVKLPTEKSDSLNFGTVVHAAIERYLNGEEVFVEGWHVARSRFSNKIDGRLNRWDRPLAKKLIQMAIKKKIIEPTEGQRIEVKFSAPLITNKDGKVEVRMNGFIDLLLPCGTVVDHKTAGFLDSVKTPEQLAENTQMRVYSMKSLIDSLRHGKRPESVKVRHNVFLKNNCLFVERSRGNDPTIKVVDAEIPVGVLVPWWKGELRRKATRIARLWKVKDWEHVPIDTRQSGACEAYGGCPYAPVCPACESDWAAEKVKGSMGALGVGKCLKHFKHFQTVAQ